MSSSSKTSTSSRRRTRAIPEDPAGPRLAQIPESPAPPTSSRAGNSNVPSTPTKVSMSSSFLPYQYRRNVKIPSERVPLPPTNFQDKKEYVPIKLGLGSAPGNLRVSSIVCSKKALDLGGKGRKYVPGSKAASSPPPPDKPEKGSKVTPGGDPGASITSRMRNMMIYESPKSSKDFKVEDTACRVNPEGSVTGKLFLSLNKKANYLGGLGRKASFWVGDGRVITAEPRSSTSVLTEEEREGKSMAPLFRHFRNILGWKLSIHMSWKLVEEKVAKWYSKDVPILSLQEIGEILKITPERVALFEFDSELEHIFHVLKENLCHAAFPNIARILAIQKLQMRKPELASSFMAEMCGMYLHSEIVDKHLTFIRRNEEAKSDPEREKSNRFKHEVFWKQVRDVLEFSSSSFGVNGTDEFRRLSSFSTEWNIVQICSSVQHSNRFGYDLLEKQAVPQLILSAFGFLPKQTEIRSEFTTLCREPVVEQGSALRHGLLEAFEKLLDKNLKISDDQTIISRKKYWEERSRHNDAIQTVICAMEDWISPWTFLLPGTIKDSSITDMIQSEVLTHKTLSRSTDSQKFVIYRLTDGYSLLPSSLQDILPTLVSCILITSEDAVQVLCKRISRVGASISPNEPRNPTILVIDQDVDILPWESMSCFTTTNVTRMPSLNLINSQRKLCLHLGGTQSSRVLDKRKCTFVLNPDGTLPQVQTRLEQYLTERSYWNSVIGRSPTTEEMQTCLETQDIFLYCGHGAGSNFYPEHAVQKLVCRAIPILMGCSSAQSHFSGKGLYSYSSVHAYLTAGCTSVVGFLWEVTDTECDRITVDFIDRWLSHPTAKLPTMPFFDSTKRDPEEDLVSAWKKSRTAATQLLTQCAAVCYGLPIVTVAGD